MHRTLKQEVAQPPAANRRKQQRALDRFRQEYNEVRPHEALGMRTPAEVYAPSARRFPKPVPGAEYPVNMLVRRVRPRPFLLGAGRGVLESGSRSSSRSILVPSSNRTRKCQICAQSKMLTDMPDILTESRSESWGLRSVPSKADPDTKNGQYDHREPFKRSRKAFGDD
jgi:hypothetical protein